jgi:hypothetical protein
VTPHSIPQCSNAPHKSRYTDCTVREATDTEPTMEVPYLLPKNFQDMTLGPLGYAVPTLLISLAPRLLKPPHPWLLIPQSLVVLSFNIHPLYDSYPLECQLLSSYSPPCLHPSLLYPILLFPSTQS